MISWNCIPLSVRVKTWSLSLFSSTVLEEFLNEDVQSVMTQVAKKDKKVILSVSDTKSFLESVYKSQWSYIQTAFTVSSGSSKSFIKGLLYYFEIENLKIVARMLFSNQFNDFLYPYELTSSLLLSNIQIIKTFQEFRILLEDTCYKGLLGALDQTQEEENTLYWEMALDDYYISKIIHRAKKTGIQNAQIVKKLVVYPLLCDRIVLLYRYRFHYDVDPKDVIEYIPNIGYMMPDDCWIQLASKSSHSEFIAYLVELGYLENGSMLDDASALRIYFSKRIEHAAQKELHKKLTSIVPFIAFIQLKKIQNQKIFTIIESKSLQVSKLDIIQFL